jgi:hypothetical protein
MHDYYIYMYFHYVHYLCYICILTCSVSKGCVTYNGSLVYEISNTTQYNTIPTVRGNRKLHVRIEVLVVNVGCRAV